MRDEEGRKKEASNIEQTTKQSNIQYPSDTRYKAFCVSNAFIANAKRV